MRLDNPRNRKDRLPQIKRPPRMSLNNKVNTQMSIKETLKDQKDKLSKNVNLQKKDNLYKKENSYDNKNK